MGRIKTSVLGLMVVVLLAGVLAWGYARWTHPISEADAAVSAGQYDHALAEYAAAEARFDEFPATKQIFASDYNRVVANQLWLLYRLHRYDDVIDKAQRSPEGAYPHFWAGCALFQKAQALEKPQERREMLGSAQQELRDALAAAPDDWDTKYNFEMVARLLMRPGSKTTPVNLLRKEPSEFENRQVKPQG